VLFDTALELRSSLVGGKSHSCDRTPIPLPLILIAPKPNSVCAQSFKQWLASLLACGLRRLEPRNKICRWRSELLLKDEDQLRSAHLEKTRSSLQ
jgi:hypothetical protein